MPRRDRKLLNSLHREEFTDWLTRLADAGDIAGAIGGSTSMLDPIGRYLKEELDMVGTVGRFEFFRNFQHDNANVLKLPGWAVEMQMVMDKEPIEEVEDDGVTRIISAEHLLEILEGVPE